jgi:hypothetical protein
MQDQGNQQAKRQSQKNQTRVSRGRQARPTQSATIQINRQTRQSARETRRLSVLKDEKMINKRKRFIDFYLSADLGLSLFQDVTIS